MYLTPLLIYLYGQVLSGVFMPTYDLAELMSFATSAVGRRSDLAVSDVSRLVNEAYFEVWYASDPEEAELITVSSTTTGVNRLELPSDFLAPISATLIWSDSTAASALSSYMTLNLVSIEQMDGRNPQPSGTPVDIAFFNSWAEIYPSPNSAFSFQLRYRSHLSDMTVTTSVPSLSTPWRRAVSIKAKELVAAEVEHESEAKHSIDYIRYVSTLKTAKANRQSGEFKQNFNPTYGGGGRRKAGGRARGRTFDNC